MNREEWAESQRRSLLAAGITPVVTEETIKRVLSQLPDDDVNLAEWTQSASALRIPITESSIHDSRIAWYAASGVPARFKRVLDATE